MPSDRHEAPLGIVHTDPEVTAVLLGALGMPTVGHESAHTAGEAIQVVPPSTVHADSVVVFTDADRRPVWCVIVEVQGTFKPAKLRSWAAYLVFVERVYDVRADVLILCHNAGVARQYRRRLERHPSGADLSLTFVTPTDLPLPSDVAEAGTHLARTAMSVLLHGNDARPVLPLVIEALEQADPTLAVRYAELIVRGLPEPASHEWSTLVSTSPTIDRWTSKWRSDAMAEGLEEGLEQGRQQGREEGRQQGREEGREEGRAGAVLEVLEARGISVPVSARDRILATTDHEALGLWLRRAVSVENVDDLFV